MRMSEREVKPPEETTRTLEDYENKHDDYRTVIDEDRYVTALTTRGTALVKIEEDKED